ncbi:esterase-like activity of phytase family protein, partial [Streptomyces sp. SID10244]|nr:esterase-like activity of phytase family protein [Streptomyces sp. SID10244]
MSVGGVSAAPASPSSGVTSFYRDSTTISGLPTFGGISGIDRTGNGTFALISTDVGRFGPARYYNATIPFSSTTGVAS